MKQTRIMMGMPITLDIADPQVTDEAFEDVFDYFQYVDDKFSTYKESSEISRINRGELTPEAASSDMRLIFTLAEQTRQQTEGYFDIRHNGEIDPSGIVKGWAIYNAAQLLREDGFRNFYVDAGGDIEIAGKNQQGQNWRLGIRNPFNIHEMVKVLSLSECGIATSGTSIRGDHIYNPVSPDQRLDEIVSLTIVGPNVYEADRFATAAFAMGRKGIYFVEALEGFEGYMIDRSGKATYTTGFSQYVNVDLTLDSLTTDH